MGEKSKKGGGKGKARIPPTRCSEHTTDQGWGRTKRKTKGVLASKGTELFEEKKKEERPGNELGDQRGRQAQGE